VRIDAATRFGPFLAWPPKAQGCGAPADRPHCPPLPCPLPRFNPDYATFLEHQAETREIARPTYADVLDARVAAARRADQIARADDGFIPLDIASPHRRAPATADHRTPTPAGPAPQTAERRAASLAFRRAVETIDNRGSLIDLLL